MALARTGAVLAGAAALAVTAACGGGAGTGGPPPGAASPGQPTGSPPASAPPQEAAAEVDETITVRLAGGEVSPPPRRVRIDRGARVRIVVRADSPDTVHVHGYDIEERARPGAPAVLRFPANRRGVFEVEAHESGTQLFQLLVR